MSELENNRSNFYIGQHDALLMTPYPQTLDSRAISTHQESQRALVHWSGTATGPIQGISNAKAEAKPDAVDDDDCEDENRPFTPPPPRERLSYTRYQIELLNGIYEKVRYPNSTQKLLVAKRVGITREQVKVWFQNRRRKDVVGNVIKSKIYNVDTIGSGVSGLSTDSEAQHTSLAAERTLSESMNSKKDEEMSVVPTAVMKKIIGELVQFTEDPLKGKKTRKKSKKIKSEDTDSRKEAAAITILSGNYDMISSPNQITPTAYNIENLNIGFNHSPNSSAFVCPRGKFKPAQINKISSICRSSPYTLSNGHSIFGNMPNLPMVANNSVAPFHGVTGLFRSFGFHSSVSSPMPPSSTGSDIPGLSDLLSNRSPSQIMTSANSSYINSSVLKSSRNQANDQNYTRPETHLNPFLQNRLLNDLYQYPLPADHPVILSSLRPHAPIYRPSCHYPLPHFSDDPYHPLPISSLQNPSYCSPSASLQSPSASNSTTYTQL